MATVALTGATGFIGNALLDHLVEQGFRVRALYRPASISAPTPKASVQWQAGDLADPASLRALVTGVDAVVHCAGTVRGICLEHFRKANVEGVARLLEAATEQKVPRFLLISSLAAREPALSAYALSKRLGEETLLEYGGRISWDILRPPAVYGRGDREMQPLLKLIRRGIVPIAGDKNGRFSLLYVDDLATAVACLLKTDRYETKQCFELHDGHPGGYSWQQIAMIAAQLNGKNPYCISLPRLLLQIIAALNASLARLFGYRPMLTPGKVRELFHPDWVCDNKKICAAVAWQPQVSFLEGMKRLYY